MKYSMDCFDFSLDEIYLIISKQEKETSISISFMDIGSFEQYK